MKASMRETFLAWATTDEFAVSLGKAQTEIERRLAKSQKPYVAYSGGKDSTVMTHLILAQAPGTMVFHWDYGRWYIPGPVHEEILRNAVGVGATNLRVETSPEYERLKRTAQNVLGREFLEKLLPAMAAEGYDLSFVGLRKQESVKRRHRINAGRSLTVIPESWPLAEWSWLDVWAYIASRELPYLSLYDIRCELMGWDAARFTTLFDPEFYCYGSEAIDNVLHWRYRNG